MQYGITCVSVTRVYITQEGDIQSKLINVICTNVTNKLITEILIYQINDLLLIYYLPIQKLCL